MTEEGKLLKEVEKYLKDRRIFILCRYQAAYNSFGLPDIMCLYKGVLVGLELKSKTGKPTKLQERKINEINKNKGYAVIVRSVKDVDDVFENIDSWYTMSGLESFPTAFMESNKFDTR